MNRSFISVSLTQRSGIFFVFVFGLVWSFSCVCLSFSSLILQLFSTLLSGRIFKQLFPRMMFYLPVQILSQTWLWLAQLPVLHLSIPPPTTDGSLGREIMAYLLFLHLLFTLPCISQLEQLVTCKADAMAF